jgi:hypothetical protein
MKLYTSRYQNKGIAQSDLIPVGITLGNPRFKLGFVVAKNLRLLAPPREIFRLPNDEFVARFRARLDEIGVGQIGAALADISTKNGGGDLVLLCFEDVFLSDTRKNFCHRRVFAQWWQEKTGEEVAELGAPEGHELLADRPTTQLTLWD